VPATKSRDGIVTIGWALAAWATGILVIAALAATRRGARAGVWLAIALLPLPAFVAETFWPWMALLELALLFAVFRAADLAADPSIDTFPRRLAHLASLVDKRRMTRVPPHFEWRALLRIVLASAVFAAALWIIGLGDRFEDWRHYALRWYVGGAPLPFAAFEILDGVLALVVAAFGRAVPPVNRAPWMATSLSDFWSRRWNSIINTLLRDHVYRRLAHRGAIVAMTVVFIASAALHVYLIGMLLGPGATLAWAIFFLVQAAGMWLERRLRVRRWPRAWGHAWTLGALLLVYPLFVEPVLQLLERL
jgi:hypothetical protein